MREIDRYLGLDEGMGYVNLEVQNDLMIGFKYAITKGLGLIHTWVLTALKSVCQTKPHFLYQLTFVLFCEIFVTSQL